MELIRRLVFADRRLAVVAIVCHHGSIQASGVNAGVLDHPLTGHQVVAPVAIGDSAELKILRHSRRATGVCRAGWQWVGVEGHADLTGPDDALDGLEPGGVAKLLRDVFTTASGTHDWPTYDRMMAEERRAAVFVRLERAHSNR